MKDFDKLTNIDQKKAVFLYILNYWELKDDKGHKHGIGHIQDKIIGKMLLCLLTILKYHDSEEPDIHNIKTTVISTTIHLGKDVVILYLVELFKDQVERKSFYLFKDTILQKKD